MRGDDNMRGGDETKRCEKRTVWKRDKRRHEERTRETDERRGG